MFWLRLIYSRLYGLLRKNRIEQEMDDEMRFHLLMRTRENIERGMRPEEAEREARRRFGNVGKIKDLARDIKGGGFMETLLQDMRYGARMLLKKPGFTAVAVTLLAFGIGGSSIIFSVANAALFKPLPFKNPDRLAIVWETYQGKDIQSFAVANYVDVRDQNQVFEQTAMLIFPSLTITGGDEPERVSAVACSSGIFSVLGVNLAMGRAFTAEEEQLGKHRVVVLSHGFWQRRFAGVQDILGKEVQCDFQKTMRL